MAWSDAQRKLFVRACSQADLGAQRYTIMRYAGCPSGGREGRPSVKHPRNHNRHFELAMSVVESFASQRNVAIRPPGQHKSWREAADRGRERQVHLVKQIADEARTRMPDKFGAGFLAAFITRMTKNDDVCGQPVDDAVQCDACQLYRIIEGLKAWVGREFADRGMTARTFAHAKKRGAA